MKLVIPAIAATAVCAALVAVPAARGQAPAPIFMEDFENGAANTAILAGAATGARWLTVSSGAGTSVEIGNFPNYQASNATFGSGNLYMRLFDNDATNATGAAPRVISSNAAGTDNRRDAINGQLTTFSFNFLETSSPASSTGLSFGYTNSDDLNAAKRSYRAFLRAGMLNPDDPVNLTDEGTALAYDLNVTHTLWMVTNDTQVAQENYRGEQTLDPGEADIWISLAGADPVFAFSTKRQNAGAPPLGVGFRYFSTDRGEVLIDNVLLMPGITFDRTAFNAPPGPNANFDGLGVVDAADLAKWKAGFGKAAPVVRADGDADADSDVDGNDFLVWQRQLGTTPAAGAALAVVPEPSAIALAALALVAARRRAPRRR